MDVFNLQASIELELAEFERRLDQAENDMKKFSKSAGGTFGKVGGMLKNGIVAGAKAAVAGVTALTVAVAGLAISSAKSFSTFEQLSSGAQKIFDEIDYEKIARDADNAYKDLNMSANQYLESINLVGATFAQTMGDEKGYDTARAGMLAISDYASGTGKSIDELNQKYQMITRATSSYQSIADQFSGVLPATSADFLAQAQAAGLLSNEYKKLTEVPVAEYQQALTAMLEKGVSDLGLSQNTLRESTETMTGSLAMATAAWENLKVAMAGGGDIDTAMQNFASSASSVIKNIIPTFQTALKGVGTLIRELAPVISKEAPKVLGTLFKDVGGAVADALPILATSLTDALPQLLSDIGDFIKTMYPAISETIGILFPAISTAFLELAPLMVEQGAKMLIDLVNGLASAAPMLIPQIVTAALEIIKVLTSPDVLVGLIDAALKLTIELANGLIAALPILLEQAPIIIKNVMQALTEAAPLLIDAAIELVVVLAQGIVENIPLIIESVAAMMGELLMGIEAFDKTLWYKGMDIITEIGSGIKDNLVKIGEAVSGIVEKIKNGIADAISAAATWGADLIDNFVQGIKDKIYKVTETVSDVAQTVKDYIGFSEPDKGPLSNFHTYAPDMIDLYTQGINSNQHKLIDSVRGMAANVKNSLDINANSPNFALASGNMGTAGAISSGIVQNISVNLTIEGSSLENDVDEITDRAVEQIADKLKRLKISDNRALGGVGW